MNRLRMFWSKHPITLIELFVFIPTTLGFIWIAATTWKYGGFNQLVSAVLFMLPVSIITWLLEDTKWYEPGSKERRVRITIAFFIGILFAAILMYFGHQAQSPLGLN